MINYVPSFRLFPLTPSTKSLFMADLIKYVLFPCYSKIQSWFNESLSFHWMIELPYLIFSLLTSRTKPFLSDCIAKYSFLLVNFHLWLRRLAIRFWTIGYPSESLDWLVDMTRPELMLSIRHVSLINGWELTD